MRERLESVRKSLEMLELHEILAFVNEQAERMEEVEKAALTTHNMQAERIQKLEKRLQNEKEFVENLHNKIKRIERKNHSYKQALEFYADRNNYQIFIRNGRSNIEHDGGERARKELERDE